MQDILAIFAHAIFLFLTSEIEGLMSLDVLPNDH